jgi:intracellular septation protein
MQLLVDFLPIIVFFGAYKVSGVYVATTAIIGVMTAQIAWQWFRNRTVNKMLLTSGVLVAIFGGATLILRNRVFAAAFLGSQFIGEKTLTERVMGHTVELDAALWKQLNMIWVANFAFLGAANLYVVYNYDEATWVNFKLFGMLGLTLLTAIGQALWISARTTDRNLPEN